MLYRERIIHILGAKPHQYDTPNVILRLKTEGLDAASESSASEITRILETVGTTNSKGRWSLKPQCLGELDVNWNFYSDTDKQLVSRSDNPTNMYIVLRRCHKRIVHVGVCVYVRVDTAITYDDTCLHLASYHNISLLLDITNNNMRCYALKIQLSPSHLASRSVLYKLCSLSKH